MDIKTHVRKKNVKTAEKILRKGRGAWGNFVNEALEKESMLPYKISAQELHDLLEKEYKNSGK